MDFVFELILGDLFLHLVMQHLKFGNLVVLRHHPLQSVLVVAEYALELLEIGFTVLIPLMIAPVATV